MTDEMVEKIKPKSMDKFIESFCSAPRNIQLVMVEEMMFAMAAHSIEVFMNFSYEDKVEALKILNDFSDDALPKWESFCINRNLLYLACPPYFTAMNMAIIMEAELRANEDAVDYLTNEVNNFIDKFKESNNKKSQKFDDKVMDFLMNGKISEAG